jgi:hypothetical protein
VRLENQVPPASTELTVSKAPLAQPDKPEYQALQVHLDQPEHKGATARWAHKALEARQGRKAPSAQPVPKARQGRRARKERRDRKEHLAPSDRC